MIKRCPLLILKKITGRCHPNQLCADFINSFAIVLQNNTPFYAITRINNGDDLPPKIKQLLNNLGAI